MVKFIRIESLLTKSILNKNSYRHFRPINLRFILKLFQSELIYKPFETLTMQRPILIRCVVSPFLVRRRLCIHSP